MHVIYVAKRDGSKVEFSKSKIMSAVKKALSATGEKGDAERIATKVTEKIVDKYNGHSSPTVEHIQDIVELVLIEEGLAKTAKAYILYRQQHNSLREEKKRILGGLIDDSDFTINQLKIAEAKYLARDDDGKIIETPKQMFRRIAKSIAKIEKNPEKWEDAFFGSINSLEFVPAGRTLANAGIGSNQLANCFVIPVKDSMEDIFDAVKWQALVQKTGGGTGFDFSELRSAGSRVIKSNGVASGPVTFIEVFNAATNVIMQGNRRGANMGILRVDHPDILEFIRAKEDENRLTNFNISVSITDKFMDALEKDEDYDLVDPSLKRVIKTLRARNVFDLIVEHAWKSGEPGVIFIDRMNKDNKIKNVGMIQATNPCGEVPLLPFEVCNLGSINLSLMVKDGEIDWQRLEKTVRTATRMLDNVIDAGTYPLPQIDAMAKKTRRIGLGLMGLADLLYQLNIKYDCDSGVETAEKIMKFINDTAHKVSKELAEEKGIFPAWKGSEYEKAGVRMRNCALTSIAPTGTLSMLAETSGGCEPNFAICFMKRSKSLNQEFIYVNKYFEKIAKEKGFYSEELMEEIANKGTIQHIDGIPDDVKEVFVVSHDITPEWHIRMQGALQKYTDNSISKTINFPNEATIDEVKKGYMLAWQLGCKGVTVYRDGSRQMQVLNINKEKKKEEKKEVPVARKITNPKEMTHCPECKTELKREEGCVVCHSCGFSACSL